MEVCFDFISFGWFFLSFSCFIMLSVLIYEYLFWLKSRELKPSFHNQEIARINTLDS